ncbi:hypothetical protein G6F65_020315 [Rhizopus arrhizus]|nr:hypothetical protein G6F65_020315 [Rhizopus arrhizus]
MMERRAAARALLRSPGRIQIANQTAGVAADDRQIACEGLSAHAAMPLRNAGSPSVWSHSAARSRWAITVSNTIRTAVAQTPASRVTSTRLISLMIATRMPRMPTSTMLHGRNIASIRKARAKPGARWPIRA